MRTEIEWAELHAPLFLNGTNLSQKLNPKERQTLSMEYDEEKRHLYVTYKGTAPTPKTCRIPETSVLSMVEAATKKAFVQKFSHDIPTPAFDPAAAQVSSPTSHVFAGLGGGLTGQEHPKQQEQVAERKRPGPKPKVKT